MSRRISLTVAEREEAHFQSIAEEERRLLRLSEAAGTPRDFVTNTELRLCYADYLDYREWLNTMMYPEE